MQKVKMILSWCIPTVLITVALMFPTIAGAAGVIKIWPDQLISTNPNTYEYRQSIDYVVDGSFYAPLTLPRGARITNITYYHRGLTGTPSISVAFYRIRMGYEREYLGGETSTDSTGQVIPIDVELFGDTIIKAGYRYYIAVVSANSDSHFHGVKINYQE